MKNSILILFTFLILCSCEKDASTPSTPTTPPTPNIPEEFAAFEGIFDGEGVGAAVNLSDDILLLFNAAGDRYAWFEDQEIKIVRDIDASDSHFADSELETVGASCLISETRVYIYDAQGEHYTLADFDADEVEGGWNEENLFSWSSSFFEVWQWGPDNTIPFSRVSAMWTISGIGSDCFDATVSYDETWMADGNGNELTVWSIENFNWPSEPVDIDEFTVENNCGGLDGLMPFSNIGAACRYIKPNQIQDIIFSEDGTQFCFYTVSEGVFSEVYDL